MDVLFHESEQFNTDFGQTEQLEVTLENEVIIPVTFTDGGIFDADLSASETFNVKFGEAQIDPSETYQGAYEVTPSQQTQVLPTNGKVLTDDITVKPIPSNYGLITWNGSILTVS